MKPFSFTFFSSCVFSKSPHLDSLTAAASTSVRALHTIQSEVSFDQTLPSGTASNIDHVAYMKDFCSLIRNLSNNSRNYGALRDLDSMLTKTHYLDYATSFLVIDGLCRLNKLGRATSVLSNLKKKGNVSDYLLYSSVIHCLVKEGRIYDVESVWNDVCGCGSDLSSNRSIDASDFLIYICKFGKVLEIESVSKRILMGGGVLKKQSYIALIGAVCRENKCLLAKDVLRVMKKEGLRPDNLTYLTMFQCFCRNGDLTIADSILRELVRRNYNMDICIYGSFIYGLCKMGMLREADKLFHKLMTRDHSGDSHVVRLKEGRRVIFQLNCQGVVPEIMVYETYFKSLCSVGRLDEAEMLLKEMMRKKAVPEVCVYKSFIKALCRAGRAEDAIKFFNVERNKGFVPVEELVGYVSRGLCQMGRVDDAWRIFNEIIINDGGFIRETDICNCILGSYFKLGRIAEALSLFERMQDGSFGGSNVSTYMVMVNGLCEEGNILMALSIFDEMLKKNIPVNATLYEVIIRGLCSSGRLKEAHKYLNEMIENGHLVSYVRWKLIYESAFVGSEDGVVSLGF